MKKYKNNFTSYAVVATIAAAAGSAGTLWMQRYNKTHNEKDYDDTNDIPTDSDQTFASGFTMSNSDFGTQDTNTENIFKTENASIDSALDYEDEIPIETEPGE